LKKNQHSIKGHNPRVESCPLIEKNSKNLGVFEEFGFRVVFEKNGKNGANGRPEVGGYGGGRPAMVFWWWVAVGWMDFVF
jgi:hypothetical protein